MLSFVPHILIIDDEEINHTVIAAYFNEMPEEYILESAIDGVDGWGKLQQSPEKFDVILLDRVMPRMDGMTLLDKIKKHPVLTHLPVIFQSGLISKDDIAEGMRAGANYYLTKPFEYELLHSVIRTAVRERVERRRLVSELTDQYATMSCLQSGTFKFKSVLEGNKLAILLANTCPDIQKSALGFTELFLNAVEHGNLGISYDKKGELNESGNLRQEIEYRSRLEKYKDRKVEIVFLKTVGTIVVTITDEGDGFNWKPYLSMAPERVSHNHGRGIAMAALVSFDEIEYLGCGNKVKVAIKLADASN